MSVGELYYTVEEVAVLAGVTPYTVRRWLREGKLKGKRFGLRWRIEKDAVLEILPNESKKKVTP